MRVKTNFFLNFSLRLNMNLISLRLLFIKAKSDLYNSLIITKQLVQQFMLSYTWPKSFHLPLTGNFQYHLSVLCNFEQIFHSGYHNHSTTCVLLHEIALSTQNHLSCTWNGFEQGCRVRPWHTDRCALWQFILTGNTTLRPLRWQELPLVGSLFPTCPLLPHLQACS